ncbi:MAG: tyrosine-protein kinase family protein [Planctomycetota bacterium]
MSHEHGSLTKQRQKVGKSKAPAARGIHPILPIGTCFSPLEATIQQLWATVVPLGESSTPSRILFTCAHGGEGTTTIATCTAIGLARHWHGGVLLLEADSSGGGLAADLDQSPSPGLVEVMCGEAAFKEALRPTDVPGLEVLPTGREPGESPGEFSPDAFGVILEKAIRSGRQVIVDGPPLLDSPFTRLLLRHCDGAVVVIEAGRTRHESVQGAIQAINELGVPILGTVLNRYRPEVPRWISPQPLH